MNPIAYLIKLVGLLLKVMAILIGGASLQIFWEYQLTLAISLLVGLMNLLGSILLAIIIISIVLIIITGGTIVPPMTVAMEWIIEVMAGIMTAVLKLSPLIASHLNYIVIILISGVVVPSYGVLFLKGMVPASLVKMLIPPSMSLDDKLIFVFKVGINEAIMVAKNNTGSYSFWVGVTWILSYFIPSKKEIVEKIK